ncbi:Rrf2 family transcriptional regulator [Cohnella lubricantis]|uniref:Rrf2 family transcriptional regulator n=1 Tax=Cohnella lubricantis TaxID=2163172 RepID=A0A841THJ0_9BACL|nr:Rrf2 family transcriptional regulator [Cohnella lubricantis]MBB6679615.1 Rrf2 family transcriptional regulator [Cohnella lubricantis]MBP2120667.1 Rrf2 family protein [Cohnella lubricantis]
MAIVSRYTVALHILTWIALATGGKDEFVSSDRIANSVNTSPVFIRRILGKLNKGRLVKVQHGGTGAGWKLARQPKDITFLDVYEAVVDTPLFELHHSTPNDNCAIGKGIQPALSAFYSDTEKAMKQQLAKTTIADLLQESVTQSGWELQDLMTRLAGNKK